MSKTSNKKTMTATGRDEDYDVVIVGAGLSGLAAANRILEERKRSKVLVLEARNRVGGRVLSVTASEIGVKTDVGAGYVGPTQDRILNLAGNFGIDTYKVFTEGNVIFRNGLTEQAKPGSIDIPPMSPYSLLDFNALLVKLDRMAAAVDTANPAKTDNAEVLDNISVEAWISENSTSPEVKNMFCPTVDTIIGHSSANISMLFWLWYIKSGDTIKRLMDVTNGAQERKFKGGADQLPSKLAETVIDLGGDILMDNPVTNIDQTLPGVVTIVTSNARIFTGKRLILALPPTLYKNIEWQPSLPPTKTAISNCSKSGCIVKTVVFYKENWWRNKEFNGQIWDTNGPVLYSMDDSPQGCKYPALMGFIVTDHAKKWSLKTKEERKKAILLQYVRLFQTDEALEAVDYVEQDWNQELSFGGGPVSAPGIGSFKKYFGSLLTPFERVHFAGSELATQWAGYMDGAIQSGERAADEVLHSLFKLDVKPREYHHSVIPTKPAIPGILEKSLAMFFDKMIKDTKTAQHKLNSGTDCAPLKSKWNSKIMQFFILALALIFMFLLNDLKTPYGTTGDLRKDIAQPVPILLLAIGTFVDSLPWTTFRVTNAEELLEKGSLDAGLPPKYSSEVVTGIEALCNSIKKDDVKFHFFGRANMHDTIVSGLSHYLQINEIHRLNPELSEIKLNDLLVVTGLPRTGTTHLHRLLSLSPDSISLRLWEQFYPAPPQNGVDYRRWFMKVRFNLWKWIANRYAMDSIHYIHPDEPDECLFSMRLGGASILFWDTAPVFGYLEWLLDPTKSGATVRESYKVYRRVLQIVQAQNPEKRLVLKNPSHTLFLETMLDVIPEANIVFTHRNPVKIVASSTSLHARLHATSVSDFDFDRSTQIASQKLFHVAERMVSFAKEQQVKNKHNEAIIFHSSFSRLVRDPQELIEDIYSTFNISMKTSEYNTVFTDYLKKNKRHSRGKHLYTLNGTSITDGELITGFKEYMSYFEEYIQ